MKIYMKIAGLALALVASTYSGYYFGYVDGVIETTADFLTDNPSAVCDLSPAPRFEHDSFRGSSPSMPF